MKARMIAAVFAFGTAFSFAKSEILDVSTFFSGEDVKAESFSTLLADYKKNDISMEKARISLEQAQNSHSLFKVQNGFDVTVSSGAISIPFSDEGAVSASPSAKIEVPDLRNLQVEATAPVSKTFGEDGATGVNGAGISASVDLINSKIGEREISFLQSERSLTEARRNFAAKSDEVEKNFWTEVQEIYSAALSLLDSQKTLYDSELDFQVVQTQGYGRASATYRQKEIKVRTAKNNIFDAEQDFRTKLAQFAQKTGRQSLVFPVDIPELEAARFEDFSESDYSKIESAQWSKKIAELKKDANKNFSLDASAGYKYYKNAGLSHGDGAHEIQAGLDAGYRGFDFGIGVSVPANDIKKAAGNFSISWNLGAMFGKKYENRSFDLAVSSAEADLKAAQEDYGEQKTAFSQRRDTLLWKQDLQKEELDVFRNYFDESKTWLEQGLITQSQLSQAERDWQNALAALIKCRIDIMLYNLSAKSMFAE